MVSVSCLINGSCPLVLPEIGALRLVHVFKHYEIIGLRASISTHRGEWKPSDSRNFVVQKRGGPPAT